MILTGDVFGKSLSQANTVFGLIVGVGRRHSKTGCGYEERKNVMADHWMKLMICLLIIINVQVHGQNVSITIVHSAVSKGAVCLDGTPRAYHYDPGVGEAANNWLVYLEGGAWCGTEGDCVNRTHNIMGLGSSNLMGNYLPYGAMLINSQQINPYFYNWNRVVVRYCDGASFSSDVEKVNPKTNLHLRGARIFKAIMEELLQKGMKNANNAILAGGSAGGLAAMLKCDEFRALLPNIPRVKCVADCGVFFHGKGLPGAKELREKYFANVIKFHGLAKFLPKACTSKMDPHLCLFPENFIGNIKTPLFIVQSAFDGVQLAYMVRPQQPRWVDCFKDVIPCNRKQVKVIKEYRKEFLQAIRKPGPSPSRGFFIDSCFYHDHTNMPHRWNGHPILKNKTIAQAIGDWYYDISPFQEIENIDFPYNCTVE